MHGTQDSYKRHYHDKDKDLERVSCTHVIRRPPSESVNQIPRFYRQQQQLACAAGALAANAAAASAVASAAAAAVQCGTCCVPCTR